MTPIKLTPAHDMLLDRTWRILSRLAVTWAVLMLVLAFSGLLMALPQWVLAVLVSCGLLGAWGYGVACYCSRAYDDQVRAEADSRAEQ